MTYDYVFSSYGALSLETHQVDTVPDSVLRIGVTQATGVPCAPFRGEARRVTRKKATGCKRTACIVPTKLPTVLQLDAEGVTKHNICVMTLYIILKELYHIKV